MQYRVMHRVTALFTAMGMALALATAPVWAGGQVVYRLEVSGLACPFCAYGLEKQLKGTAGVLDARVDLEEGVAVVTVEEGARFDRPLAEEAVTDAGFTLNGFESSAEGVDD